MGDEPIYLPQQRTRRGIAGYKGDNVVVVQADGKKEEAPPNSTKRTRGSGSTRVVVGKGR